MKAITIELSPAERNAADAFARTTLERTYNRYPATPAERIRRIRVGKLAEIAFVRALNWHADNWRYRVAHVFSEEGEHVAYDFKTRDGQAIDIKTASKDYHRYIMIPKDQQDKYPKAFFVGFRISRDESRATLLGYQTAPKAEASTAHSKRSEYDDKPAYWIALNELNDINELFRRM